MAFIHSIAHLGTKRKTNRKTSLQIALTHIHTQRQHTIHSPTHPGTHKARVPWPRPHLPAHCHNAQALSLPPRPRVFPTVDMSHWSPNTDLGVSLQRAIYISLSICQPVAALVSLPPSLSLPLPLWGCQSLFHALSLCLCFSIWLSVSDFCRFFSAFCSLLQAGLFPHSLLLPHTLGCSAPPILGVEGKGGWTFAFSSSGLHVSVECFPYGIWSWALRGVG